MVIISGYELYKHYRPVQIQIVDDTRVGSNDKVVITKGSTISGFRVNTAGNISPIEIPIKSNFYLSGIGFHTFMGYYYGHTPRMKFPKKDRLVVVTETEDNVYVDIVSKEEL